MSASEDELRVEFEVMARRAGVTIPDERRDAFFAAFKDLRKMTERLRRPRAGAIEVASTFSVESARKGEP